MRCRETYNIHGPNHNVNNVRRIVGTDDDIRVDTTGLIYESKVAVAVAKRVRYNKGNY